MKKLIACLALVLFVACTQAQPVYYAYQVDDFSVDTAKTLIATSRVISCGDYLFEFKMQVNNEIVADMYKDENKTVVTKFTTRYDTTGVYILAKGKGYYEFDTFALTGKLVKKGPIADREFGFKLGTDKSATNKGKAAAQPKISAPQDTVINGIPCYYVQTVRTQLPTDSMGTQYFLIKNRKFTSVYKAQGFRWLNNEYCIIGVRHYAYNGSVGYSQEINNLRPLSAAERKICESLIQKARLPLPR
jgi:hypothetical protein